MEPYPSDLVRQVTDLPTYRELSRQHAGQIPSTGREFRRYARQKHEICSEEITHQDVLDYLSELEDVSIECVRFNGYLNGDHFIDFVREDKRLSNYYESVIYDMHEVDRAEFYTEGPKSKFPSSAHDSKPSLVNLKSVSNMLTSANSGLCFDGLTLFNIRLSKGCTHSLAAKYTIRNIVEARRKFVNFGTTLTTYDVYLETTLMMLKNQEDIRYTRDKFLAVDDVVTRKVTVNGGDSIYVDDEVSLKSTIDSITGVSDETIEDKISEIRSLLLNM